MKVTLKGLRGGHSGLEINEGRANANKLLVRFVREAVASYEAQAWLAGKVVICVMLFHVKLHMRLLPFRLKNEEELLGLVKYCEDLFNEEYFGN